ncbi:MAG: PstS family phosphate ABC transporter substrate-binding protein [Deltaproteobacteria bacterium]|nr:PstS family phosphate ABC transporter substrate-binding protein [Deltaproteobacteria bacterium]
MTLLTVAILGIVSVNVERMGLSATAEAADRTIIAVDGSSTVYPITEAVAEEFQKSNKARVTVGISGTGGGFKKFCAGETVISDASRPIKPTEVEACKKAGIDYIELPVAYDGLAVVVNPKNTWVDKLTVAELKQMWAPEAQGKVTNWNQIRPGFPDEPLHLFGPGVDSGTYDYFTEAVVGQEHASRGGFTASEDDNVLVQGVSTDKSALGFFGFAYYIENADSLKVVPVDDENDANGKGGVAPSVESVATGTYQPLSRPIFIYVSKKAADTRPEVKAFVNFYLDHATSLVKEVGYIPLPGKGYGLVKARFEKGVTGSVFGGHGSKVGVTIEELLSTESK